MKTILITGGAGFLGKIVIRKLEQKNHRIIAPDSKEIDLSHPQAIQKLLPIQADFVFHLAAKTRSNRPNPEEYYRGNVDTLRPVLEYCRIRNTPLHYVSSSVYGDQKKGPISEKTPPNPSTPYAHSKWLGEEMTLFYTRFFSLQATISRPFNIYGPGQTNDFFIPNTIEKIRTEPRIEIKTPDATRDFVFGEDVADALIALMTQGRTAEIYNIGTGISFSCKEVAQYLQEMMNAAKPIVSEDPMSNGNILHSQADIRKICSETDWKPKYSLKEGLSRCLY